MSTEWRGAARNKCLHARGLAAAHKRHAGVRHAPLVALVLGAEHEEQRALLSGDAVGEEALRRDREAHGAHRVREHHLRADRPQEPAFTSATGEQLEYLEEQSESGKERKNEVEMRESPSSQPS